MDFTLSDLTAREELNTKAKAAIQFALAQFLPGHPGEVSERFAERMGYWGRKQVANWQQKTAVSPLDTTGGLAGSQPYRPHWSER